jgi:tetrahydromethanopterin S-methyltransferase subunit G
MGHRYNIGSLTPAQVAQTDVQLSSLWRRIGEQNDIVKEAREAGFDAALINELTARGNALMNRIEALSIQVDGLSSSQYDEWRNRLQSFGTEVDLFTGDVQTRIGTQAGARNWKIAGSTLGALAIAGIIGGAVWYFGRGR